MNKNFEMSSINIKLKVKYHEEAIIAILHKGQLLNFKYFENEPEKPGAPKELIFGEAAKQVVKKHMENYEYGPSIYLQFNNSRMYVGFYQSKIDHYLELYISDFQNCKTKDEELDLVYYLNLFLNLCEDYTLLSINTKSEIDFIAVD